MPACPLRPSAAVPFASPAVSWWGAACLGVAALLASPVARADLGPENVLLVVNGDSVASRTVANEYIAARGLADVAVVVLHDLPDWEATDVDGFRDRILKPVLAAADARGLAPQLDCIVYSTAIPTKIALAPDLRDLDPKPGKIFTPYGSLTGLTTLYEAVLQKNAAEYLSPRANAAFADAVRGDAGRLTAPPTVGFRRAIGFGEDRQPTTGPGRRYLVSSVLGVTTGRGETVEEVVARIRATAAADGTAPTGAVLFCDTKDVRSTTRKPLFAAAVAGIEAEATARGLDVRGLDVRGFDVRAEVIRTALPRRTPDLFGLTAGLAGVKPTAWTIADSRFVPGAFADNLTSFGGVLSERVHGQVTAVDWLRFGAAASGGTVHEPYALAFKFPSPFVHLHRLRGVTLGEAILRSVAGPYQYLTVGDPLSNPHARRPVATLGLPQSDADTPLTGRVPLTLAAVDGEGNPVKLAGWELSLDGKRFAVLPPGRPFVWDTADVPDGMHELTAVAVAADAAQSRGRAMRTVTVKNGGRKVVAAPASEVVERAAGRWRTVWGDALPIGMSEIGEGPYHGLVVHHGRELLEQAYALEIHESGASIGSGCRIDTCPLGLGAVTLRAGAGGAKEDPPLWSRPVHMTIVPPPNRPATVAEEAALLDGPALRWEGGEPVPLPDGLPAGWLKKSGAPGDASFTLSAVVTAAEPGLHRLALRSNCGVTVMVDGEPAPFFSDPSDDAAKGAAWRSVPVWLEPGRHTLALAGRAPAKAAPVLEVRWGRRGLRTPTGATWRRVAAQPSP